MRLESVTLQEGQLEVEAVESEGENDVICPKNIYSCFNCVYRSYGCKTKPLTLNMLGISRAILHCGFSSSSLRQKLQIPGPAVGMVSNVTHGVQRIDDALVSLALQYTVNLDPDGLDLAFS